MRAADQVGGDFQKLNAAERQAKKDWDKLVRLSKRRAISQSKSQLDNLS